MIRALSTHRSRGFSLVELLAVIVCLGIAAALVAPTFSGRGSFKLVNAARLLIADLEHARSLSLARGDDPAIVVFDRNTHSYFIAARSAPATPLSDPVGGGPYITRYGSGRAAFLQDVRIESINVGGDAILGFGPAGELDQVSAAQIVLACGRQAITVSIDPVTGEPTASDLHASAGE